MITVLYGNNITSFNVVLNQYGGTYVPSHYFHKKSYNIPQIYETNKCWIVKVIGSENFNQLDPAKLKEIVHGDYSDQYGNLFSAKQLIILSDFDPSYELIFIANPALKARCTFIQI